MTTIKAYTDLSQSKKLAEILPLESADMFYTTNSNYEGKIIGLLDVPLYIGSDGFVDTEMGEIYAWSLAALLGVLPDELEDNHFLTLQKEKNEYCCCYEGLNNSFRHNTFADNPVDACYEMIIKLHELNLL